MGLKKKVVRGTVWVFIAQIFTQAVALIKNIILARILSPDDFGLFGIALVVFSLLEAFSRSGFDVALIQKKEDIRDYLDTAFVVNIGRGIVLFLLLFFSAQLVAAFFNRAEIVSVVRAVSFVFLLNGFVNPGTIYFLRELEFKKQFQWDMSRSISDIIVTLSLVFFLRNVWVLVIGMTASFLTRVVVSYLIHPYRPGFSFNPDYARSLFRFGKWVLGSGILIYLLTQGDDAFVGKFLGITALGFYRIAYRFSNLPATHITHVISRVTFPAYSRIQEDKKRLKELYLRILNATIFLSVPLSLFFVVASKSFVLLIIGKKWLYAVPSIQLLALWGVIRSVGATTGPVLTGIGKPYIATKLQALQLFILMCLLYPFTLKFNLAGTSMAVVLASIIPNYLALKKTFSVLSIQGRDLKSLIIPFVGGVISSILFFFILKVRLLGKNLSGFIGGTIFYLVIYLVICYILSGVNRRSMYAKMVRLFSEFL